MVVCLEPLVGKPETGSACEGSFDDGVRVDVHFLCVSRLRLEPNHRVLKRVVVLDRELATQVELVWWFVCL